MALSHTFLGLNSFLFATVVLLCLWIGHILRKYKIYYIPDSGASMIIGFLVGGIALLAGGTEASYIEFQPEIFFFVLLPPIIFNAGFGLKRRNFFRNFTTICMFAVMGTIVSTLIIGYGLYACAKLGWIPLDASSPLTALLIGALMSDVDPVATLSILGAKDINAHPTLYTLVFGESVLNDAVAIALFNTLVGFETESFTNLSLLKAFGQFCGILFGSIGVGCGVALMTAFMFKHADLTESPAVEIAIVFLTAYASYCLAEIIEMSGIISLFFCGILMAHYTWYNLSHDSRVSTRLFFGSFSIISETFLFVYMGITVVLSFKSDPNLQWNFATIACTLALCFISRAFNIFPFSALVNVRRKHKITFRMQVVMWFAGLRGAIAFALALNFPSNVSSSDRAYVVTTTLAVITFTVLVLGGLTAPIVTWLGLKNPISENDGAESSNDVSLMPLDPGATAPSATSSDYVQLSNDKRTPGKHGANHARIQINGNGKPHDPARRGSTGLVEGEAISGLHKFWRKFDDNYMKKWFGIRADKAQLREIKRMSSMSNAQLGLVSLGAPPDYGSPSKLASVTSGAASDSSSLSVTSAASDGGAPERVPSRRAPERESDGKEDAKVPLLDTSETAKAKVSHSKSRHFRGDSEADETVMRNIHATLQSPIFRDEDDEEAQTPINIHTSVREQAHRKEQARARAAASATAAARAASASQGSSVQARSRSSRERGSFDEHADDEDDDGDDDSGRSGPSLLVTRHQILAADIKAPTSDFREAGPAPLSPSKLSKPTASDVSASAPAASGSDPSSPSAGSSGSKFSSFFSKFRRKPDRAEPTASSLPDSNKTPLMSPPMRESAFVSLADEIAVSAPDSEDERSVKSKGGRKHTRVASHLVQPKAKLEFPDDSD